jgi:hypothetical protein
MLIWGSSDQPERDRLHLSKIGGTWIASYRGGEVERLSKEKQEPMAFSLPYSGRLPAQTVADYLKAQNPGLLVIIDHPVLT